MNGRDYAIDELAAIADVEDVVAKALKLAVASPRSLRRFWTFNDARVSRRELERIASGRLVPPWPAWPTPLPEAIRYILPYTSFERPVLTRSVDDLRFGDLLAAKQLARLHGSMWMRVGTFPPVLPARVVYAQVETTLHGVQEQSVVRLPALTDSPACQLLVGVEAGCQLFNGLLAPDPTLRNWLPWLHTQLAELGPRQSGLLLAATLRGGVAHLPAALVTDLLAKANGSHDQGDPSVTAKEDSAYTKAGLLAACWSSPELLHMLSSRLRKFLSDNADVSMVETEATLFALSQLKRHSSDRQLVHDLCKLLFLRNDYLHPHEQLTEVSECYDEALAVAAGIAIGQVVSGMDVLTDAQASRLVNGALGRHVSWNVQLGCLMAILLMPSSAPPSSTSISTDDYVVDDEGDDVLGGMLIEPSLQVPHEAGYVRFVRSFVALHRSRAGVGKCWLAVVALVDADKNGRGCCPWTLAAFLYQIGLLSAFQSSMNPERREGVTRILQLLDATIAERSSIAAIGEEEPYIVQRDRLAWDFCLDVALLSMALAANGSGEEEVLLALRQYSLPWDLQGNFGRLLMHQQAIGLVCMGVGHYCIRPADRTSESSAWILDRRNVERILLSTFPMWQASWTTPAERRQGDPHAWPMWHRLAWMPAVDEANDVSTEANEASGKLTIEDCDDLSVEQLRLLVGFQDAYGNAASAARGWSALEAEIGLLRHVKPSLVVQ